MKKPLGPINALYPSLTVLVGALVGGKPNFATIAHVGILNHTQPQFLSVSLKKGRYTTPGILEQKAFGISLPSADLVAETDYMGIVSGHQTDKSQVLEAFYGELGNAPMAVRCPVCMEMRLHEVIDLKTHDLIVGELAATWAEESVLKDGRVDLARSRPLLFDMASRKYWSVGQAVAECWVVGKALKKETASNH